MANLWVPYFDRRKPRPTWFDPKPGDVPNSARGKARYRAIWRASVKWSSRAAITEKYREARSLRDVGLHYVVDHIVPLSHPLVCGLHAEHNLRVIRYRENSLKSNAHWPDMPEVQAGFDFPEVPPVQGSLL